MKKKTEVKQIDSIWVLHESYDHRWKLLNEFFRVNANRNWMFWLNDWITESETGKKAIIGPCKYIVEQEETKKKSKISNKKNSLTFRSSGLPFA